MFLGAVGRQFQYGRGTGKGRKDEGIEERGIKGDRDKKGKRL
jgi:hypothetical protein